MDSLEDMSCSLQENNVLANICALRRWAMHISSEIITYLSCEVIIIFSRCENVLHIFAV